MSHWGTGWASENPVKPLLRMAENFFGVPLLPFEWRHADKSFDLAIELGMTDTFYINNKYKYIDGMLPKGCESPIRL